VTKSGQDATAIVCGVGAEQGRAEMRWLLVDEVPTSSPLRKQGSKATVASLALGPRFCGESEQIGR
jgi:hypothetical protein